MHISKIKVNCVIKNFSLFYLKKEMKIKGKHSEEFIYQTAKNIWFSCSSKEHYIEIVLQIEVPNIK